jgi:hypothetical protein
MKHLKKDGERGFIKYIVIIIAAVILIAYFKTDIQNFFSSPAVKGALLTAIGWIQQTLLWIVEKLGWTSSQIK